MCVYLSKLSTQGGSAHPWRRHVRIPSNPPGFDATGLRHSAIEALHRRLVSQHHLMGVETHVRFDFPRRHGDLLDSFLHTNHHSSAAMTHETRTELRAVLTCVFELTGRKGAVLPQGADGTVSQTAAPLRPLSWRLAAFSLPAPEQTQLITTCTVCAYAYLGYLPWSEQAPSRSICYE